MFITCQQCSTIFRLDESLLKTSGSKVRCSQCGNVFVEYPPAHEVSEPVAVASLDTQAVSEEPADGLYDQQLDGIDLDELDAIFEQGDEGNSPVQEEDLEAPADVIEADDTTEFDEADLDMDFDLEASSESDQAPLDEQATAETTGEELDDLDLDIDFDLDANEPIEDSAEAELAPSAGEASDDLGFDLDDLDFTLDGDSGESEVAAVDNDAAGEDADLIDELDALDEVLPDPSEDEDALLLDIDEDAEVVSAAADDKSDDFDLAELDDMLGGDDVSRKVSAGVDREAIDEDAELALDDIGDDEIPAVATEATDSNGGEDPSEGIDLTDLDAMLDEVDGQADQGGAELELEPDADKAAPVAEDDVEELNFELDTEFEDKPVAKAGATEVKDDEIDLSDIEHMLEGDDAALDTQQLEADFLGLDSDTEMSSKGGASELDLDDTDEINLDEIEAAIDDVDDQFTDDTLGLGETEEQELTLEEASSDDSLSMELSDDIVLELDSDDSEPVAAQEQSADDDLDLSDLDLDEDPEIMDDNEVIDTNDIELEFQVEEDEPALASSESNALVAAGGKQKAPEDFSIEDTVQAPQADETELHAPPKPKTKKSATKSLVWILILLLLGGAGYIYYAVLYQGLDIPYVSQLLRQEPKDPAGILKLSTLDINSKFVDTESSGRLFVIEGKVRNGYSVGRQMIRLQGKLYTKGKVLAKSEFAYAGVDITDEDLTNQPVADLKKKLNSGIAQGAGTKVNPGGSITFMVIFSELPDSDELDEFAISVISSMASK